jgi:glycine/D-amino acid oxidase-like deaminating enzyme
LGSGFDTAQVTPGEFVSKLVDYLERSGGAKIILGTCVGMESIKVEGKNKITGVKYREQQKTEEKTLPADVVIVCAGPWSCAAEDWFDGEIHLPMEGVKSTSIVWEKPVDGKTVEATALFCGEDDRFGTHCTS